MKKPEQQGQSRPEQFPSNILYSSPPEVQSLSAWVREMQNKQSATEPGKQLGSQEG